MHAVVGIGEKVSLLESAIKSKDTVLFGDGDDILSGRSNEAFITISAEWDTSSGDVLSDVDRMAASRDETCLLNCDELFIWPKDGFGGGGGEIVERDRNPGFFGGSVGFFFGDGACWVSD